MEEKKKTQAKKQTENHAHELVRGTQFQTFLQSKRIPSVFTSVNPKGVWLNMIAEQANKIGNHTKFELNYKNKPQDQDLDFSVCARADSVDKLADVKAKLGPLTFQAAAANINSNYEALNLISGSSDVTRLVRNESFLHFYLGVGGGSNQSGNGDNWEYNRKSIWTITKKVLMKKLAENSKSFWTTDQTSEFHKLTNEFLDKNESYFKELFKKFVENLGDKKNLMTVIALFSNIKENAYIASAFGRFSQDRRYSKKLNDDASTEKLFEEETLRDELLKLEKDGGDLHSVEYQLRVLANNQETDSCSSENKFCANAEVGWYRIVEPEQKKVYNSTFAEIGDLMKTRLNLGSFNDVVKKNIDSAFIDYNSLDIMYKSMVALRNGVTPSPMTFDKNDEDAWKPFLTEDEIKNRGKIGHYRELAESGANCKNGGGSSAMVFCGMFETDRWKGADLGQMYLQSVPTRHLINSGRYAVYSGGEVRKMTDSDTIRGQKIHRGEEGKIPLPWNYTAAFQIEYAKHLQEMILNGLKYVQRELDARCNSNEQCKNLPKEQRPKARVADTDPNNRRSYHPKYQYRKNMQPGLIFPTLHITHVSRSLTHMHIYVVLDPEDPRFFGNVETAYAKDPAKAGWAQQHFTDIFGGYGYPLELVFRKMLDGTNATDGPESWFATKRNLIVASLENDFATDLGGF